MFVLKTRDNSCDMMHLEMYPRFLKKEGVYVILKTIEILYLKKTFYITVSSLLHKKQFLGCTGEII